ncbi:MAG: AMP-binding protein [Candidatus Dormibacteria bacterium]
MTDKISFPARLRQLATDDPARPVLIFSPITGPEETLTYKELDRASDRASHLFAERGVGPDSTVVIGLRNCPAHYVATWAAWKVGALVLPLSASLPPGEREGLLDLADAAAVVADWDLPGAIPEADIWARGHSEEPLPDVIPHPGKSIGSGGSTGRSKIIIDPNPLTCEPGVVPMGLEDLGLRLRQVQLIPGPLYHNSPFGWGSLLGIPAQHTLVLMERFDAARAVDLIERHRVNFVLVVPTMMRRILQLPGIQDRDLSSMQSTVHTAAPCPPWVKEQWIDLVGAEKVFEGFGATEAVGTTWIRGDEWLEHHGSVGRPRECDLKVLDETGHEVPAGTVGEIFMRPHAAGPTYVYRGSAPAKSTDDGFQSVGDLGWVDEEGYLYVADRRTDMIISGGANIYPAEVEAALVQHPEVDDVAVIGLPDDDLGRRVHAVIRPRILSAPPSIGDLKRHSENQLARSKVPRSWEFVSELPRNDMGKIRRSALLAEREQTVQAT